MKFETNLNKCVVTIKEWRSNAIKDMKTYSKFWSLARQQKNEEEVEEKLVYDLKKLNQISIACLYIF